TGDTADKMEAAPEHPARVSPPERKRAVESTFGQCATRALDDAPCAVPPSEGCMPPARCIAQSGTCQVVTAASCM
ncbi:MAG TPA: hypothetical protein VE987_02740, partial [Polyangiaceae bacterium]|nr:hypothetical protein [Polyangiaceae bacterium]